MTTRPIPYRRHLRISGALLFWAVTLSAAVRGADIRYTLVHVDGDTWEYVYTVTHDGRPTGAPLQAFAVGFDPALYREPSLDTATAAPLSTWWDEQLPASGLVLGAFYDVQASAGGISVGESVSGFCVRFDWTGPGVPGGQPFWIFAPGDPAPRQQGRTGAASAAPIPMGGAWLNGALALGVLVLALWRLSVPRRAGER